MSDVVEFIYRLCAAGCCNTCSGKTACAIRCAREQDAHLFIHSRRSYTLGVSPCGSRTGCSLDSSELRSLAGLVGRERCLIRGEALPIRHTCALP